MCHAMLRSRNGCGAAPSIGRLSACLCRLFGDVEARKNIDAAFIVFVFHRGNQTAAIASIICLSSPIEMPVAFIHRVERA